MAATNSHLCRNRAADVCEDEHYTRRCDIDAELAHYKQHLDGKRIHLPCDPMWSAFWLHFVDNYGEYGLAGLTATSYNPDGYGTRLDYNGSIVNTMVLPDNGSFDGYSALRVMDAADVVVSNPPFSQVAPFIRQIQDMGKDYLIVAPFTAVHYPVMRHALPARTAFIGPSRINKFRRPDGSESTVNCVWLTSFDHGVVPAPLELTASYHADPSAYPRYDNYDAIEVGRLADIPADYDGLMGVPETYINRWNPAQFDVVEFSEAMVECRPGDTRGKLYIDGRTTYGRLIIKPATPGDST